MPDPQGLIPQTQLHLRPFPTCCSNQIPHSTGSAAPLFHGAPFLPPDIFLGPGPIMVSARLHALPPSLPTAPGFNANRSAPSLCSPGSRAIAEPCPIQHPSLHPTHLWSGQESQGQSHLSSTAGMCGGAMGWESRCTCQVWRDRFRDVGLPVLGTRILTMYYQEMW